MRRKVIALLLLAIMILGIGCSSNPQRESSSQGEVEGHGFKLVSEEEVADIRSTLFVYRHEKTGAELIWIKNDDPFKVFAVNFKTKPRDDKGVAHIIEHTVLGGSKKYYSNDMFIDMEAISTNAFMNAATYTDKTLYPFSSKNDKDFANLTDLYLNAVFFPRVLEDASFFRREGWRYEILHENDPITYNGVVYNEMRGAYADHLKTLQVRSMASLYPDTVYAHDAGGNPDEIPKLTYEEFLEFYRTHYHPSNALFYFYGDVDIEYYLNSIGKEYLAHFEGKADEIVFEKQAPLQSMNIEESFYNIGEDEDPTDRTYLAYKIHCFDGGGAEDYFILDILSEILVDVTNAPVRNALMEEGIGLRYDNFSAAYNQSSFGVAVSYANPEDAEQFVETVDCALRHAAENGLDRGALLGAVNKRRLRFTEANGLNGLKGLYYLDYVLHAYMYGGSISDFLNYNRVFDHLQDGIDNRMFESFIEKNILGHSHKSLAIMKPDPGLSARKDEERAKTLKAYKESLSAGDLDALVARNLADERRKHANEESVLPRLSLEDVNIDLYSIDYEKDRQGSVTLLLSAQPTNGLTYVSLEFDLSVVEPEKLPYATLLADLLCNLGTEGYETAELENAVNAVSDGINASVVVTENGYTYLRDSRFILQAKSHSSDFHILTDLIEEVVKHTDFSDDDAILQVITEARIQMEHEFQTEGLELGLMRAKSYFSPIYKYADLLTGFDYLRFLQDLEQHFMENPDRVRAELREIAGTIFNQKSLLVGICSEEADLQEARHHIVEFVSTLPQDFHPNGQYVRTGEKRNEAVPISGDVNFVIMGGNLLEASDKETDSAAWLLPYVLNRLYLYPQLRQKRGAYGAFVHTDSSGNFLFYSYRDPNIAETIEVFRGAGDFLTHLELTEDELDQIKIGYFKEYPMTPEQVAHQICYRHVYKITNSRYREGSKSVQRVGPDQFRRYGEILDRMLNENHILVIGNERRLRESSHFFDHVFPVSP